MSGSPRVVPVPCLRDNYAYLVTAPGSTRALVVDASEAAPVDAALAAEKLELAGILATHHHWDHVGGHEELARRYPGVPIVAHDSELASGRVPGQSVAIAHGQEIHLAGLAVRALHVPGHTLGAVAYCIGDAVFTGDTLFIAGCGRLFEGTPEMMFASLAALAALPPETRVYCGHEYTAANLRFALTVEPDNAPLRDKLAWAEERSREALPTVPSTIASELATNPFLRARTAADFARLRAAKDSF